MDVLYGLLIGLVYPSMVVIVAAVLKATRLGTVVALGSALTLVLAGPVIWLIILASLGFLAAVAAFAGWVVGMGIAAAVVMGMLASRFKGKDSRPRWTIHSWKGR